MGYEIIQTPTAMAFDLPLIGDDLAKIGRIIQLYTDPCSPVAEVWVYGFFQSIPTLFIALNKPELIDINIKKGGHRHRKGRKIKFGADALFRDAIIEVPVPRWVVFRVYEWTQRIGWYFLVADATENFAINWMSLAYKYNGCQSPLLVYGTLGANNLQQASSLTPSSRRFVWDSAVTSNVAQDGTSMTPTLDGTYDISWSCSFAPATPESISQLPYSTHLTIDGVPSTVGEVTVGGAGQYSASGHQRFRAFGPSQPVLRLCGAWNDANKFCQMTGTWTISRTEDSELEPDP